MLNALTGGEGDSTFSAWSYHLVKHKQSTWGAWRVKVIDGALGEGHCERSYDWHMTRDLISKDSLDV